MPKKEKQPKNRKKIPTLTIWRNIAYIFPTIMCVIGAIILNIFPIFTKLRWIIIAAIFVIDALLLVILLRCQKKNSKKGQIAVIVLAILFGLVVSGADYLYYHAIQTMNSISTNKGDMITSDLYVKSDAKEEHLNDLVGKTIAVQPSSSTTMYTMLVEAIEEAELKKEDFVLAPYSSYIEAYEAFLNKEVDAIVLDGQATESIKQIYPEFDTQAKRIETFTKWITSTSNTNIDVSKEPFTILINGVDIRSGNLNEAANADVIMLATFNPQTMKLSLNSIPRDTYLPVTCRGFSDKITHSGTGGVQCTISSLEEAFDINIDYYVKVNFFAVVDLVEALGGIEVDVPFTFDEQDSHDNQNAIHVEKGLQTLNGEEALALARHRKSLPRGDIDRGLDQQLVIEGILKKAASMSGVLNVDKLLDVVGNNVQTNMPTEQMYGLFQLLTNIGNSSKYGNLSALSIQMETINGTDDMHVPPYTSLELYFYLPYEYSMQNTTRDIKRILGEQKYPLPTNTFAFNANVPFSDISDESIDYMDNDQGSGSYNVPDTNSSTENLYATMPNFVGSSYREIYNWCNSVDNELPNGYSVRCEFSSADGSAIEDDAVFVSSSRVAGSLLSKDTLNPGSNHISFIVANKQEIEVPNNPEPSEPNEPEDPETPIIPEEPQPPIDPEEPTEPEEKPQN